MRMASTSFLSLNKIARLTNGTIYGFIHVELSDGKPYALLLHGFPSSSYDGMHHTKFLSAESYSGGAPELLDYGDTDKPEDPAAYKLKKMGEEMSSILDHLDIKQAVGFGHDCIRYCAVC